MAHSCRSYCNKSGYYSDGFSCGGVSICCGALNVRYCCDNISLSVPSSYPEKCYCPQSSCSALSWDILLPCIASGLFVLLMITICCCQGCRRGARFRQWWQTTCLRREAEEAEPESSAVNVEPVAEPGIESSFPHLPPYEFGPPKYDSLELTEAPPKYEEAMRQQQQQQQQQHYDNVAFVGDVNVTNCSDVTPDVSVTCHDRNSSSSVGDSLTTRHQVEIDIENDCGTSQGQGRTTTTQGQDRVSQGHCQGHDVEPSPVTSVSDRTLECFPGPPHIATSSNGDPVSNDQIASQTENQSNTE